MPTETLTIVSTGTSQRAQTQIKDAYYWWPDGFATFLAASNWTLNSGLRAGFVLNFVFFWWLTDGQLVLPLNGVKCEDVDDFLRLTAPGGTTYHFKFYDPGRQLPSTDCTIENVIWVQMKTTITQGLNEIRSKIQSVGWLSTLITGSETFTLDDGRVLSNPLGIGWGIAAYAPQAGSAWNDWSIDPTYPAIRGEGKSGGGGWEYASQTTPQGTTLYCSVFWDLQVGTHPVNLDFAVSQMPSSGSPPVVTPMVTFSMLAGDYYMLANQYGCTMFPVDPDLLPNSNSFLSVAPLDTSNDSPPITGKFAFCVRRSAEHMAWPYAWVAYQTELLPIPSPDPYDSRTPRMLAPHFAGFPVRYSATQPITTTALVMFEKPAAARGNVVGLLADCVVMSDYFPVGSRIKFQGKDYTAVAAEPTGQPGPPPTIATLFWAES